MEGYHIGSNQLVWVAMLPVDWTPLDGLEYPTQLIKTDGTVLTFYSYREHHEYISQLFKKSFTS